MLRDCKAQSTMLSVEPNLGTDILGTVQFEGTVADVRDDTRTVVFNKVRVAFAGDKETQKEFHLALASSFTLTVGASGGWALTADLGQQGNVEFRHGETDPPEPLA
jgi:hypothetical protein